jgi:hypothetical protein
MAAMNTMLAGMKSGGVEIWVAHSGGRDRRDVSTGKIPITPFDQRGGVGNRHVIIIFVVSRVIDALVVVIISVGGDDHHLTVIRRLNNASR